MVTPVAFVVVQVSIVDCPAVIEADAAEALIVGELGPGSAFAPPHATSSIKRALRHAATQKLTKREVLNGFEWGIHQISSGQNEMAGLFAEL